jgi:hypothetical protein
LVHEFNISIKGFVRYQVLNRIDLMDFGYTRKPSHILIAIRYKQNFFSASSMDIKSIFETPIIKDTIATIDQAEVRII